MTPTVSVIMPCYNASQHIRFAVEAILEQTIQPQEIIVVDDASTDESVSILKTLPVTLLKHDHNYGPAQARNTGLKHAHGDIIVYVDSDAYADSRLIEVFLQNYTQADPKLAGVGGRGIDCVQDSIYDKWRALHAIQNHGLKARSKVPFLFGLCSSYIRDILFAISGHDPAFTTNAGEDLDIGYRLNKAGYHLAYRPDAIVLHHHKDDENTLKQGQYNWYYWSYLAKWNSNLHPWTLTIGTLRRAVTDTIIDLIFRRSIQLAQLNIDIIRIKLQAISDARRYIRTKIK